MVIVHAFTRTIKKRTYLMVDTSTDSKSKPLFASPEILFEASGTRDQWIPRVKQAILGRFPELVAGEPCLPGDKRKTKTQCFDIPFFEKEDKTWISNLIL